MKLKTIRERGMTLVELIIVVAIVAILGMIAYPNYSQYQMRANRMEAKTALEQIAVHQERFYVNNFSYTTDLSKLGVAGNQTESGLYLLSVPNADADGFQVVAAPAPDSRQTDDLDCQQFTIDNQSVRNAIPDPNGKCW